MSLGIGKYLPIKIYGNQCGFGYFNSHPTPYPYILKYIKFKLEEL